MHRTNSLGSEGDARHTHLSASPYVSHTQRDRTDQRILFQMQDLNAPVQQALFDLHFAPVFLLYIRKVRIKFETSAY